MKLKTTLLAAVFSVLAMPAFAQMTGQYKVDGKNPDGSSYKGTASVEKTGDTYRIVWMIGGTRTIGTGIGSNEAIAISYRNSNNTGVVLLAKEGDQYFAVWTYLNGRELGMEKWTRE